MYAQGKHVRLAVTQLVVIPAISTFQLLMTQVQQAAGLEMLPDDYVKNTLNFGLMEVWNNAVATAKQCCCTSSSAAAGPALACVVHWLMAL